MDILYLPVRLGKIQLISVSFVFLEVVLQNNIRESNAEQELLYCHYLFISCIHGNPAVNISPVVTVF